jgi:hypothetical protein
MKFVGRVGRLWQPIGLGECTDVDGFLAAASEPILLGLLILNYLD